LRIIRFTELESQPWKNGGGVTREIAALRRGNNILWRISIADVAVDGPFSRFPGLTRILTVIEGNGIRLHSEDGSIEAQYGNPVQFDGGLTIQSELVDGPIRDLNVMFDPLRVEAHVALVNVPLKTHAHQITAIIGLTGNSAVNCTQILQFGDTALIENKALEIECPESASALIITLNLRQQRDNGFSVT
jgi:uncharacterized protein